VTNRARLAVLDELRGLQADELRRVFLAGDPAALIAALLVCCRQRQPLPDWVQAGAVAALGPWLRLEAGTLDEAFGLQRGAAGGRVDRQRVLAAFGPAVLRQVRHRRPGETRRAALRRIVEDSSGALSLRTAQRLLAEVELLADADAGARCASSIDEVAQRWRAG